MIIILQSDCAYFSGSWCFVNSFTVTLWTFPLTMIDCIVFYTISAIFQPYNGSSTYKFGIGSRYYIIFCYYYRSILYLLFLTYTLILIFSLRIDPGLKYTVYCTAIKQGGQAEWDFAYNQYKTSQVASERAKLLSALSCTKVPWLLKRCGIVDGFI